MAPLERTSYPRVAMLTTPLYIWKEPLAFPSLSQFHILYTVVYRKKIALPIQLTHPSDKYTALPLQSTGFSFSLRRLLKRSGYTTASKHTDSADCRC